MIAEALLLILLHGADQQPIAINANEISSLRPPSDADAGNYAASIKCVVVMTNGKFIGVIETCTEIFHKTRGQHP